MDDQERKKVAAPDLAGGSSPNEQSRPPAGSGNKQVTSSSPIEIKSTTSGAKFGVMHMRNSPSPSGLMTDADGEPIPLDKIIKTANTMSNMLVAHKIALDNDFRLEPGMDISGPLMSLSPIIGSSPTQGGPSGSKSEPTLQSKVKDLVHDAFWDMFKAELATQQRENKEERSYEISKQLLADIKHKIIDLLLPQHTRLKQDIEDKLEAQIIDQLSKVDSLNLLDYARYILELLSKLCAPVRDEKLKELSETSDLITLYRGIMELLEMMRLDLANFALNRFKPHIKAHSQEYEREKFNEILKQQESIGIDGLEYTRVWLARAVDRVDVVHGISDLIKESFNDLDLDRNDELDPSLIAASGSETTGSSKVEHSTQDRILKSDIVTKVLNSAYCELLEWTSNLQQLYPETLLFDEATIKQLGQQYKVLLLSSSILLTLFAFVSKFKLQDNNDFRILAKSHVITLLTATYDNSSASGNQMQGPPPPDGRNSSSPKLPTGSIDTIDHIKLETVALRLCEDIRQKLSEAEDKKLLNSFESQRDLLIRQILDLESSTNRIRELARRRIMEFVETLLTLDVEHERKKFSSKSAPPVNIPLGLNCLADELTLTMAQLVKLIRYNRQVFFHHYQSIIVELVMKKL